MLIPLGKKNKFLPYKPIFYSIGALFVSFSTFIIALIRSAYFRPLSMVIYNL